MQRHNFRSESLHSDERRMSLLEIFAKAIELDDSSQVETLLASSSIDVNARLPRELNPPPLVLAVTCPARRVDIVEMLLCAGANVDGVDDNDRTASFAAVEALSADVLAALLAHRPNLEIKEKSSNSRPLELSIALRGSYGHIPLMLINAGASLDGLPNGTLCRLASTSTTTIRALLNRGVVVNQLRDYSNFTPLHLIAFQFLAHNPAAADADMLAAVKMLISVCDCDLEACDSSGRTCTFIAARSANRIALRCFIDAGGDVNSVDLDGSTLLHRVSNYKCSVLLLAAGAKVNARDREGRTAAQLAMQDFETGLLPALLAAGCDPRDVRYSDADRVESARRDIARTRLDFVRHRALQVCVWLQSLSLDALQFANMRDSATLVWTRGTCDSVSPLVGDCNHCEALSSALKEPCSISSMSDCLLGDFAKAIERNDLICIKALMSDRGVDASARLPLRSRSNPLLAVFYARGEIADVLLKAGARIDDVDDKGRSACYVAMNCDARARWLRPARLPYAR
jgi:ankyrin repeat protein